MLYTYDMHFDHSTSNAVRVNDYQTSEKTFPFLCPMILALVLGFYQSTGMIYVLPESRSASSNFNILPNT